ncbi:MAG: hypothetical protein IH568_01010 [Burkholderiaceae bacterium]|nr:hypothetical protein [Burkholderiaceae bacterium]
MVTRRTVLKAGLGGTVLLALGSTAALLIGRDPVRDRDQVLRAVIPAVLDGALPADELQHSAAISAALNDTLVALNGLAPETQRELAQLFALLAFAPLRRVLAGVPVNWSSASVAEVSEFLRSWRTHRLGLLQGAYHGLHELVIGPWYAQPGHWEALGYPGPP